MKNRKPLILTLLFAVFSIVGLLLWRGLAPNTEAGTEPEQHPVEKTEPHSKPTAPLHTPSATAATPPEPTDTVAHRADEKPNDKRPRIAIVIDDVGLRPDIASDFRLLDKHRVILTWAIIPGAQHANTVARKLIAAGQSIIAHVPMEPVDSQTMTPHLKPYLQVGNADAIKLALYRRLSILPKDIRVHIRAVSNHQGSLFTSNHEAMTAVLTTLRTERLFFLDSRTTAATVSSDVGRRLQVPVLERNVFLDNVRTESAIAKQLSELEGIARKKGVAIGIGHPYPETARALATWWSNASPHVRLVPLSAFVVGWPPR